MLEKIPVSNILNNIFKEVQVDIIVRKVVKGTFSPLTGSSEDIVTEYPCKATMITVSSEDKIISTGLSTVTDFKLLLDVENYTLAQGISNVDNILINGIMYTVLNNPLLVPNNINPVLVVLYIRKLI
jgi:hypothetical protein